MTQAVQQPVTTTSILSAQAIIKRFRMGESELPVLKGVDLNVKAGEFLAIEGRSGSGKSTLLHCLGALDAVDGGSIHYRGEDIASMRAAARSRLRNLQFGFVFQF